MMQNDGVSHSIFTQKFKATGDAYGQYEMPTFGHSENIHCNCATYFAIILFQWLVLPTVPGSE